MPTANGAMNETVWLRSVSSTVMYPYERPKRVWRICGVLHGFRFMDVCREEVPVKQTSKETRREDSHLWQLHGAPTHPDMCLLHGFLLFASARLEPERYPSNATRRPHTNSRAFISPLSSGLLTTTLHP